LLGRVGGTVIHRQLQLARAVDQRTGGVGKVEVMGLLVGTAGALAR